MVRRYLVRYVILLLILIICAGAALYFAETSPKSHEDAVLAFHARPEALADGKEAKVPWAVQCYI